MTTNSTHVLSANKCQAFAPTVVAIGEAEFGATLLTGIGRIVRLDTLILFRMSGATLADRLLHATRRSDQIVTTAASVYTERFFRHDPLYPSFARARGPTSVTLHCRANDIEHDDYRNACWSRNGVVDRYSIAFGSRRDWISCNLYREARSGHFGGDDIGAMRAYAPLIRALVEKHLWVREWSLDGNTAVDADAAIDALTKSLGARLSLRERAVCAGLLRGHTAKGIASQLGLSWTSVVTYRQRAYAKLGIRGRNSLFHLCLARRHSRPHRSDQSRC